MVVIRLQRTGRKGLAMYRMVVQDARLTPTSGKVTAQLGHYDPHTKELVIDKDKVAFYLEHGAQPSPRVSRLLKGAGIKLPDWVSLPPEKKSAIRSPEKLRRNRPKEPEPTEEPAEPKAVEETASEPAAETAPEAPASAEAEPDAAPADDTAPTQPAPAESAAATEADAPAPAEADAEPAPDDAPAPEPAQPDGSSDQPDPKK